MIMMPIFPTHRATTEPIVGPAFMQPAKASVVIPPQTMVQLGPCGGLDQPDELQTIVNCHQGNKIFRQL